jgi:Domain of unknown function (DUF4267)
MNVVVHVLTIVIGALVIFIGLRFLFVPRAAAVGYGVPADPEQPGTGAYLAIKGVRDGIYGVITLILLFTAGHHVVAWFLLAATVLPLADCVIVLRNGGSRAVAFGIHFATALVMLLDVALLLA